jgi:hypothetical protein
MSMMMDSSTISQASEDLEVAMACVCVRVFMTGVMLNWQAEPLSLLPCIPSVAPLA